MNTSYITAHEMDDTCSIHWGNMNREDHLADLSVYERIILKLIIGRRDVKAWTGFNWLKTGSNGGLL